MDFDNDVSESEISRGKYDFSKATAGSSLWVETSEERINITRAFARWTEKNTTNLAAFSRKVGPSDKRGEGYRVFFKADKVALRPLVIAKLPSFDSGLDELQTWTLNRTGLFTNEDVIAAATSCDQVPATIAEATATRKMMFAGATPFQLDYSVRTYGKPLEDQRAEADQERKRQDAEQYERMAKYRATPEMRRGEENDDED